MADEAALDPKSMSYLVNDYGETVAVPKDQSSIALSQGYRPATASEIKSFGDEIKYGTGVVNPLLAAGAGAARALSFGVSDVALTKSGLVKPETLKGLETYQPEASIGGEAAGILGAMFTPGAPGAAVRGAARLGGAITKGVAEALPEAAGVVGRAGRIAASHGAGMAAEGALYGLGRSVTEYGMGDFEGADPDLVGEKILSNVGMTAILGGTLGAALGVTGAAAQKGIGKLKGYVQPKPMPEAGRPAVIETPRGPETVITAPEGTLERAMQEEGMDAAKRDTVISGTNKLKANSQEIIDASREINAPVLESQISSSKHVQDLDSMLMQSPTVAGVKRQELVQQGFDAARKPFEESLATGEAKTAFEAGEAAKEMITKKADDLYEPIKRQFKELESTGQTFIIPDEEVLKLSNEMIEHGQKFRQNSEAGKIWRKAAEDVLESGKLEHMLDLQSEIGNQQRMAWRGGDKKSAYELGRIRNIIEEFIDTQMSRTGVALEKEGAEFASAVTKDLIAQRKGAKAAYKKFIEVLDDLSSAGRLGRIKDYTGLIERLEEIPSAKLAEKLFDKKNIEGLRFLQEQFPDVFDVISKQRKSDLLEVATKDGLLDLRKVMRELAKLPKEVSEMMFTPDQLKKMAASKTWLEALPGNINPSGTSKSEAYRRFFSSPVSAAIENIKDIATSALIKHSVEDAHAIGRVESAAKKATDQLQKKAKDIFKRGVDNKGAAIGYTSSRLVTSDSEQRKIIRNVQELRANPDKFVALLDQNTSGIYNAVPRASQSIHTTAVRAVNYLAMHAPETKSPFPLGDDPVPSKNELNIYAERVHVLNNPTSVLDEIKYGTLVPAHVEAIQYVYPKLYDEMKAYVTDSLTEAISKKELIPQTTKNMLSLFLNQDLDASITPQQVMANQMAMQRSTQEANAQDQAMMNPVRPTQKGLGTLTKSTQAMTPMQKSAARNEA